MLPAANAGISLAESAMGLDVMPALVEKDCGNERQL
jgi:hypothetical protein